MLFYVFVAFVGLNNITILAMQNIESGSVLSDRYPDPAEKASIEAIPILNIGSAHPHHGALRSISYSSLFIVLSGWMAGVVIP